MDEEIKIPAYAKQRIDVKEQTIGAFLFAVKNCVEGEKPLLGPDTEVILLTTIGQVTGKILSFVKNKSDDKVGEEDVVQTLNYHLLELKNIGLATMEKQFNEDSTIVNNSSIMVVMDAILTPYNNPQCTQKFKVLNLFADQIVGFSFGNIPK